MRVTKSKSVTTLRRHGSPSSMPWNPAPYMLKAVEWLVSRSAAALFLDPGLGKTSISFAAMTVLKRQGMFRGALVISTLRPATSTWPAEARKWDDFHELDVVVLHGRQKEQLAMERHDVYVINYEGLQWLINSGALKFLLDKKWIDVLVFDELSKMKNASKKAVRRQMLLKFLPRFSRRWGLTGSPASNGLMNLFGQVNVLDLGAAFGPYITHFRNMFFTQINEWHYVLKEGADDLIYARIAPLALRMSAEDYIKMPSVIVNDIKIELPKEARAAYDEMEDEMLTVLGDETLTAGTASAVYGKCWQIATGAVFKSMLDPVTGEPLRGVREWHNMHDEKLDALEELIDELQGQQLLCAYWFSHDLEKLMKRFGKDIPYIGSGVNAKRAKWVEDAWNAGDLPYMFGHPMSMGHGLNLQGSSAHHVAWYTQIPDFELYDQFNRRLRRSGNKAASVTIHRFIARRTVEEWAIVPSQRRKDNTQSNLFAALAGYAAEAGILVPKSAQKRGRKKV